jgi:putative ABC transport system ATP-binding protein
MAELLRIQEVSKWVGDGDSRTDILRSVSTVIQAGEFVAIMGASGSGKSTLLNLIGLLDRPSAGGIFFSGKNVAGLSDDALAEVRARHIGFVFQSFNLLSYLSAVENVELPMLYGRRSDHSERAEKLLQLVNLSHRLRAYPATLSGGERQRVAIARALANEPPLILADEPTGALDSKTGAQIMELLSELHRRGRTIILVTHDEKVAQRAGRILNMKDGRFV